MQALSFHRHFLNLVAVLQLTATVAAAVNAHVFYPRIPKAGDVVVQVPSPAPSHRKRDSL